MKKKLLLLPFILLFPLVFYKAARDYERKGCATGDVDITKELPAISGRDELRLLLIGDSGTGDENQRLVAASSATTCKELGCDMVLYLGDNFYPRGVKAVDDPLFSERFEDIYSLQIPFYSILGNHDVKGNWRAQLEYTNKSSRWIMPDTSYSFKAGPVSFSAINTNCSSLPFFSLKTDRDAIWNVVFGHRPYLSSGNHGGINALSRYFLEKLDFDLYVAGHEHMLEHLNKGGRDVVISGGGGAGIQKKEKDASPYSSFAVRTHGYVWAAFTAKDMDVVFFDGEGKRLYGFSRKK